MCLYIFGIISHYHGKENGAFKISNWSWVLCAIHLAAIENVPNSQENSDIFLKPNIAVCCNKLNVLTFLFWQAIISTDTIILFLMHNNF